MSLSIRKVALSFFLSLFCLFVLLVPLHAAEITLNPQVGFDGLFQLRHPFPLRVELKNLGPPVEGVVEVRIWKGGPSRGVSAYSVNHRRSVFLAAQSRKSLRFTVDPDSISRALTVSFSSPRGRVSKKINLRRHFSPSPLILLLTENNVSPPVPALASDSGTPLISVSVDTLPSVGRAYQGVSTIIVYEQSMRDLSKRQTLALDRWLSSGGRMIVLGGMHYALYQEPFMSRFLPVRVTGLKRLSSLPSLERVYGQRESPLRDLWVQDSILVDGNILIEEKGTPILVELNRGKGKVLYLSLDVGRPPLPQWQGLPLLFKDLLGSPGNREFTLQASWNESVFSQLLLNRSFIADTVPVLSFFVCVSLYLGGIGSLVWLWRRQRWPRQTLALTFLSLVFFSSLSGYLYFDRGNHIPDGLLVSSTLLESIPYGYVEVQSDVALFSTRRRRYDLQVQKGWTDFEPVFHRQETPNESVLVVQEEGNFTRFRVPLKEWDHRLFKFRSIRRFPFRTEIKNQSGGLSLRISNPTGKDLTDCWLLVSGQRLFLGDILQGTSQIRKLPLPPGGAFLRDDQFNRTNRENLLNIPFKDKVRKTIFQYSFFSEGADVPRWGGSDLLFFGWVKEPPRRIWVDDPRVVAYDHALFRAVISLDDEGDA
ncbi:MAG: hypothetical protein ACE5HC_03420 [Candidatus Binatia bacterium]